MIKLSKSLNIKWIIIFFKKFQRLLLLIVKLEISISLSNSCDE